MEQFSLWGTLVNVVAVLMGSGLGLALKRFVLDRPRKRKTKLDSDESLSCIILKGLGLCVILFGMQGAITGKSAPVIILSMAIGGLIGTLCDLDGKVVVLGDWFEKKLGGRFGRVSEGFVSACLLFCVGAMAITGPLESGLVGDHTTQYTKAVLDLVASVVLASSLGFGVMLSAVVVLVYQGGITLLAAWMAPLLNDVIINEMTAVGSLLIIGIGLNVLGVTKLKLMNYVPAIFLPILLCLIFY